MDAGDGVLGVHTEDERVVRSTQTEAPANLLAVLQLCGAGKLRCSERTRRPTAATVAAVVKVLAGADFYRSG